MLPCSYSKAYWGDRWRMAWDFSEHRRPGDFKSGSMWLHRTPSIHSGKTNKFKVCICMIQIYHISQDGWISKVSDYRTLCGRSMDSCLWSLLDLLYKGVQGFFLRSKAVKMLLWPVTSFVAEVKNLWVFTAILIGLCGMLLMHKGSFTAKPTFILWTTLYCSF